MTEIEIRRPADLGRLIGRVRTSRGIRQEELAEQLGFARSYLAALESGRVTVQLSRLFRVLRALRIRVSVSLDLTDTTPQSPAEESGPAHATR